VIPENRLRVYDIRTVIEALADSWLGAGTAAAVRHRHRHGLCAHRRSAVRISGQQSKTSRRCIDADAGDKARARAVVRCLDIPIVSLCDTPGFMVGPQAEKTALVRHVSRMFVTAASITVPYFTVVLRKGYGLGAQAMAGGGFHAQNFTISWPTGEFGGMGFEGASARLPQGDGGDRRSGGSATILQGHGRQVLRDRQGHQYRLGAGDRPGDRSDRNPRLDHQGFSIGTKNPRIAPARKRPCVDTW